MSKKIISLLTAVLMLTMCIGVMSVSADGLVKVGTYELSPAGYGTISAANPDTPGEEEPEANKYVLPSKKTAADPVENKERLIFLKFNIGNIDDVTLEFLSKAELSLSVSGMSAQDLRFYTVENDDWTTTALTHNSVFGDEAQYTPDNDVYATGSVPYIGTHKIANRYNFDITKILKKSYIGDGLLTVAFGVYVATNDNSNNFYIGQYSDQNAIIPQLSLYMNEPVYYDDGAPVELGFSDYGKIAPDSDEIIDLSSSKYNLNGIGTAGVPYAQREMIYVKYNLEDLTGNVETAKLTLSCNQRGRWFNLLVYLVENDSWTHQTLKWSECYDNTDLSGKASVTVNDETITAENLPAAKSYAPNPNKYVHFKAPTASQNTDVTYEIDVTDLVKGQENDGAVTLAIGTYNSQYSASSMRYLAFYFKNSYPKLTVTQSATSVSTDEIKIKVDGNETDTLTSGVLSAEAEVTSTMSAAQRTTMILAVYEGNKLAKVYVSPQQKINDKNTNGGKTLLSVSSNEIVEVGDNTSVSAFMWKDISLPLPLGVVKTITK